MNRRCLLTTILCLLLLAPLSFAATFTVTTASDGNCADFNCNLHAALLTAQGNAQADTINIGAGIFSTGVSTFRYNSSENFGLTIDGADSGLTILDGGGTTQVLNVATDFDLNNAPLTIRDLTIRNGRNDLAVVFEGVKGGGAYVAGYYAPVQVTNCKFINNILDTDEPFGAYGGGGYFSASNADLIMTNNLFENNIARAPLPLGGAAYVEAHLGNLAMTNNVFRNNSAEGQHGVQGGGAFIQGNMNVRLVDNEFDGNAASQGASPPNPDGIWRGGAAFLYMLSFFGATTSVTLAGNTFQNNSCLGPLCIGGGIDVYNEAPKLSVTHNQFKNNSAVSTVVASAGGGGAMLNSINEIVVANNVFVNNSSDAPPGMSSYAGGLFLHAPNPSRATMTNNTFASNITDGEGGGVAILADPTDIYNNIFFNNTAALNGDDIFQYGGSFDFSMNLFNNNFSELYSCQTTASCTPTINQGNNINADPLFVNAVSGDFHLQTGSPAIDAGTALAPELPSTDLDGIIRIVGTAPDMGAYELNNLPPGSVFTPVGNNVPVAPGDPGSGITVNMVFQTVTQAGMSSVTTSTAGPVPPTGFKLGDPPTYYDISTSALFTGYIDICINYSNITFKNNAKVKIFHFDGSQWVDVTISRDTVNKILCGRVTSLSPFALFEDDGFDFSGFFPPVDNPPVLNVVKAGTAVPVKFSLNGDQGLGILETGYPKVQVIACGSSATTDNLEETAQAGASTLSYDPVLNQYIYVWKTNKNWARTCRQLEVKLVDGTSHFANFNFTR